MNPSTIQEEEKAFVLQKRTALTAETRNIRLSDFIDARSQEINLFTDELKTKLNKLNKLPF